MKVGFYGNTFLVGTQGRPGQRTWNRNCACMAVRVTLYPTVIYLFVTANACGRRGPDDYELVVADIVSHDTTICSCPLADIILQEVFLCLILVWKT